MTESLAGCQNKCKGRCQCTNMVLQNSVGQDTRANTARRGIMYQGTDWNQWSPSGYISYDQYHYGSGWQNSSTYKSPQDHISCCDERSISEPNRSDINTFRSCALPGRSGACTLPGRAGVCELPVGSGIGCGTATGPIGGQLGNGISTCEKSNSVVFPRNNNDASRSGMASDPFMSSHQATMQTPQPSIEIIEQPRSRGLRFRYKCEGRSAGTIPGENSTNENRTYPTIRLNNYSGPSAIVVVSCVTKDEPMPRPHPHALVGKDCKEGVCTVKLKGTNQISFPSLGIQCATKKEVHDALKQREKIRVDPWGTTYFYNVNNIELGQVRLAFQAFLPDDKGKYTRVVKPVYSQIIYDKKSVSDLVICRLSSQSGSVRGGDEIFLLCEKVNKEDILVRFFEENNMGLVWEKYGQFGPQDVHRQVAIVLKTPEYRDLNINSPAHVYIQLKRPSDDEVSDPKPFQYAPQDPDPDNVLKKRKRKQLDVDRFFKDVPFEPVGPPTGNPTKDALKLKLERNQAKRGKPSASFTQADMQMDMNTDGNYLAVQSTNMLNAPGDVRSRGPWSTQADVMNIPFAAATATLAQTNIPSGAATDARPDSKTLGLAQDGNLMLGDSKIGMSLGKYLEGFDGTSLPSLPSLGEEFPANMQVVLGEGQGVAAEETVQSSDTPSPAQQQDPVISQSLPSLDRRMEDFKNHFQNFQ